MFLSWLDENEKGDVNIKKMALIVLSVLFSFSMMCEVGAFLAPEPTNLGVGTPGYWKNHPDA